MKRTAVLFLAIAGLIATAPIVSAEDAQKAPPASDHGMMGADGQKMQGMMDMMGQMSKMMENCNRMMESKTKGDAPKKG